MAAGAPVVAVDANGVREVVADGVNGRKISVQDKDLFGSALAWIADMPPEGRKTLARNARRTARGMSIANSAQRLASVYGTVIKKKAAWDVPEEGLWQGAMRRIHMEWKLLGNIAHAAGTALVGAEAMEGKPA
jgi:hypothetical protein